MLQQTQSQPLMDHQIQAATQQQQQQQPHFQQQTSMNQTQTPIQNHAQQDHLPMRSRSYSETQRSSTRAEKRMGRLFRQNSSANPSSVSALTTPTLTNTSTLNSHEDNDNVGPIDDIIADTKEFSQQLHTIINHSQSSSISSTSSNQITRKYSNAQVATSSPPEFNQTYQTPTDHQQLSATSVSFTKLSTLSEIDDDDPIHDLIKMSKKFLLFYKQMVSTIQSIKSDLSPVAKNFEVFVAVLENVEKKVQQKDHVEISETLHSHLTASIVDSISDLRKFIDNLKLFFKSSDPKLSNFQLRLTYYNLFSIFIELSNIVQIIIPINNNKPLFNQQTQQRVISKTKLSQSKSRQFNPKLDRQDSDPNNILTIEDNQIFDLINHTIQAAQAVFSQLNNAIAKSAVMIAEENNSGNDENVNIDAISFKIKDLTNQCLNSMEQTKKVSVCLNMIKYPKPEYSDTELHKNIYEQTNLFLKSIINILATTKGAIDDLPTLNNVRSSLSILTRATKELTIKLESSTLKQSVLNNTPSSTTLVDQPKLSSIPSIANIQTDSFPLALPQNRNNMKLRQILERNEPTHDMHLEINTSLYNTEPGPTGVMHTPLSVTTPLIASIGPTVASHVLQISNSPMKSQQQQQSQQPQQIPLMPQQQARTPVFMADGTQNEFNPFERMVSR